MKKELIVEDEILARLGLRQLVAWKKLDLELLPDATDGEEALEMIRNSCPDIILLDLNIPKVSGLEILEFLKKEADYIIDTSRLLTRELKTELEKIFVQDEEFNSMYVTILSFGFKYGIPADSDIVMDVRFLPNPYYVEELRPKTGNDVEIQQYVMKYDEAKIFLNKLEDMVTFLIPHYISEGKNQLVISIGCTGGKHRSVTLANELYKRLSQKKNREYGLKIEHRDIGKDALRGK